MGRLRMIILGMLTILATACVRISFVKPTGQISTGVKFCFSHNRTDMQPTALHIQELLVQKHIDASAPTWDIKSWKTVWSIRGPFTTECIAYGANSQSFQTVVKAVPLMPSSEYRITAVDISGVVTYPSVIFKVGPDGMVITPFQL